MDKKTITGWSIAVTWSDGKRENILDIPDEVAQYIDDYLTEIEEHGDLAKPNTELVREIQNDSKLQASSRRQATSLTACPGDGRMSLERNTYGHITIKKNSRRSGGNPETSKTGYGKV